MPESSTLISLLPDWTWSLKAEHKSESTMRHYTRNFLLFCQWLSPDDDPQHATMTITELTQTRMQMFFAGLYERWSENSVLSMHIALSAFFRFAIDYEDLDWPNPIRWVKRPKPAITETPIPTDEQIRALLATCSGKSFQDRRDYAIFRTFLATGMRLGELAQLLLVDLHLDEGTIHISRGKGGKERTVAIGPEVVRALGQYRHRRDQHKYATLPDLWLGRRGKFQYEGIRWMVYSRVGEAEIPGVHAHLLRHWFAHKYLAAGGQENSLLQLAGWSDSKMLHERYGASRARERAITESHRLGIGEKL